MMNNEKMIAAPARNRFFAFLIDVFLVYLIRFFYINLSLQLWLREPIINFLKKYKMLYGDLNLSKITPIEITYFLNSSLFKTLILFFCGVFIIPVIYNAILFSTKWSATIGQKLLGIYVVSNNGKKMNFIQIIFRSIFINVPWAFIFSVMLAKMLSDYGLPEAMNQKYFIISLILFLSWYDLIFLTKNKLVFHDYITCTRVIIKNVEKYEQQNSDSIWKYVFPDFKEIWKNLKEGVKLQISKAKEIKETYKAEKEARKSIDKSNEKVISIEKVLTKNTEISKKKPAQKENISEKEIKNKKIVSDSKKATKKKVSKKK